MNGIFINGFPDEFLNRLFLRQLIQKGRHLSAMMSSICLISKRMP